MQLSQFENIVRHVLTFEKGSDGELTINYLKDISFLLSLVSVVRECNIEQHLLAERNVIYQAFAYDHQNYARYNTYQNVYLSRFKQTDHSAFHQRNWWKYNWRKTLIHSKLFREPFNKETKGTADLFRSGFSTDIDAVQISMQ